MKVIDFIKENPGKDFDFMTPGGYVYINKDQAHELCSGEISAVISSNGFGTGDESAILNADEMEQLLKEEIDVDKDNWDSDVYHGMTERK